MHRRREFWRSAEHHEGNRDHCERHHSGKQQHGRPPAEQSNDALKHRRPYGARHKLTACDQRQRGATPAVEPVADINVARRIDAGIAEKADEQAVAQPEPPAVVAGGNHEADGDHQCAERHGPLHADAVGDAAHGDASARRSEPRQGIGQCRNRARAAQFSGDLLQRDDCDEGSAVGNRHDAEGGECHQPRGACFDTGHPSGDGIAPAGAWPCYIPRTPCSGKRCDEQPARSGPLPA